MDISNCVIKDSYIVRGRWKGSGKTIKRTQFNRLTFDVTNAILQNTSFVDSNVALQDVWIYNVTFVDTFVGAYVDVSVETTAHFDSATINGFSGSGTGVTMNNCTLIGDSKFPGHPSFYFEGSGFYRFQNETHKVFGDATFKNGGLQHTVFGPLFEIGTTFADVRTLRFVNVSLHGTGSYGGSFLDKTLVTIIESSIKSVVQPWIISHSQDSVIDSFSFDSVHNAWIENVTMSSWSSSIHSSIDKWQTSVFSTGNVSDVTIDTLEDSVFRNVHFENVQVKTNVSNVTFENCTYGAVGICATSAVVFNDGSVANCSA